jgi:hypothetical protein
MIGKTSNFFVLGASCVGMFVDVIRWILLDCSMVFERGVAELSRNIARGLNNAK